MNRRALLFTLVALAGCQSKPTHNEIIVGAATSLRHVLPKVVDVLEKVCPQTKVVVTYGASGDLARQVEGGAGVDDVVFASKAPLDKLLQTGRIEATSTRVVGTN
jgi:molybdate transport system substrate-binding protein